MSSHALQQAIDAIKAGDALSGKRLLVSVLQAEPYNEMAWLWMSSVYDADEQRRGCLERVLAINPNNEIARLGLAKLGGSSALSPLGIQNARKPAANDRDALSDPAGTRPPGGMPTWSEQKKFHSTRWLFIALVALIAVTWGVLIGWVFLSPPLPEAEAKPLAVGASLTVILAPVLVAAVAVERMLEMLFNIIESSWRALVAYLGRGLRWLKNAETEVQLARQWLADVSSRYHQEMRSISLGSSGSVAKWTEEAASKIDVAKAILALAERRLAEAEINLNSVTASARYKSAKATASILVGLLLGVIVAEATSLQMFALLGIDAVPAKLDAFMTGLFIGSGAYPVHSVVGLLQRAKDTLESATGALAQRAKAEPIVSRSSRESSNTRAGRGLPQAGPT